MFAGGLERSCVWFEFAAGGLALCCEAGWLPAALEFAVPLGGREDVSALLVALVPEPELADPEDGVVAWVFCVDAPGVDDCCGCDRDCCVCAAPDGDVLDGAAELDWDCGVCSDLVLLLGDCAKAAFASTSPKAVVANRRIMVHSLVRSKRWLLTCAKSVCSTFSPSECACTEPAMPSKSAGILAYRKHGEIEVLLVHPGGPFWRNKDLGAWSIPKGEYADGEDADIAARREFAEELGFELS